MFGILLKIIPLDLASTLSPGILALTLVILGSKNNSIGRVLALFFGALFIGFGINILGFALGQSVHVGVSKTDASAIIDLILGAFLFFYGIKIYFSKEKSISLGEEKEVQVFRWFLIGLIITVTNFDAVLLSFTAAKEVGTSNILDIKKWILLIVNIFFFTLPITLPLVVKLLFRRFADPILSKLNNFMLKYSRLIIMAMFLIFGVYLLYRGIKHFI